MHRIGLSISFLAVVFSTGCLASSSGSEGITTNQIQGGESDSGDPAVGLIEFTNNTFCTGTLITPDIILTAGHCTAATPSAFYLGINKSSATRYDIAQVAPFPGYRATNTCPNPTIDVALMKLAAPIEDVAPLSLGDGLPAPGDECTAVGYGRHTIFSDDAVADASPVVLTTQVEQKRDATETVTNIGSTTVEVTFGTGLADHGDSGGPLLCGGAIAATVSCHTDGDYPTHQNEYYARIDGISGWITAMETNFDPSAAWPPVAASDAGADAASLDDASAQ